MANQSMSLTSDIAEEKEQHQSLCLLSLPGELRNRIYRYAVVEEKPITAATEIEKQKAVWRSTQPPLALACKEIRHEVLSVFYAENAFVLPTTSGVHAAYVSPWLRSTGQYLSTIKRVGTNFGAKDKSDVAVTADVDQFRRRGEVFTIVRDGPQMCKCLLKYPKLMMGGPLSPNTTNCNELSLLGLLMGYCCQSMQKFYENHYERYLMDSGGCSKCKKVQAVK